MRKNLSRVAVVPAVALLAVVLQCCGGSDSTPEPTGSSGAAGSAGASGASGSSGFSGSAAGAAGNVQPDASPDVPPEAAADTASDADSPGDAASPLVPKRVDLLLAIDNSRSMSDKQAVLGQAVPELVARFANPPCVDGSGAVASQPADAADPCPSNTTRAFPPVTDLHVGVITSSLGGHGADACQDETMSCGGSQVNKTVDDHGRLVTRADPCSGTVLPSYADKGFLAWDPAGKLSPPGANDLAAFGSSAAALVTGAGQLGCGFESQLEGWYRFLADPNPYGSLAVDGNGQVQPSGSDDVLLAQRVAFLRPDSLLIVFMLTDEDDCSIKEYGQYYLAGQMRQPGNPGQAFRLPRARAECATNPADPCCKSCGQAQGTCPQDPVCTSSPTLSAAEDDINLRCYRQKLRFGIDFLYPADRYVTALTSAQLPDRNGQMVPNPVFSDLDPSDGQQAVRDPGLAVLAGVVGVPWQDIARDPHDLKKGYMSAQEMAEVIGGKSRWDIVLGDPATYVEPLDPLMIPSTAPRTGSNPVTGDAVASPSQPLGNPINGNEYTFSNGTPNDLQYACIFPLPAPKDCTDVYQTACECTNPANDNPLCAPDPNYNNQRTLQVRAKAYPGTRHLAVLKGLGEQGVVASICAAQITAPTDADYGYRPAVQALMERVAPRLNGK